MTLTQHNKAAIAKPTERMFRGGIIYTTITPSNNSGKGREAPTSFESVSLVVLSTVLLLETEGWLHFFFCVGRFIFTLHAAKSSTARL